MNYILGGGIAGLIYSFYNKDYTIISKDIGGQMKSDFNLGPRYLHDNEFSNKFLNDINYKVEKSKIRIGYISDKGWVQKPDLDFRKKYFLKSRKTNSLEGFDETVMNSYKSEIDILLVDFNEIIDILSKHSNTILEQVEKIDTINNFVNDYKYQNLISTIPITIFNKYTKLFNYDFKSFDITYSLEENLDIQDFDYVYDIRSTTEYHRITRFNNKFVCDHFGYVQTNKKQVVLKNAQIISTDIVTDKNNIKFIGRYGTWNRKWKTETIIERAINEQKHMGRST